MSNTRLLPALVATATLLMSARAAAQQTLECTDTKCLLTPAGAPTGELRVTIDNCTNDEEFSLKHRSPAGNPLPLPCMRDNSPAPGGPAFVCTVPPDLNATTGTLTVSLLCEGQPRIFETNLPAASGVTATPGTGQSPAGNGTREGTQASPPPPFLPQALWHEALTELRVPLAHARPGNYYSRAADIAVLFFDADGEPYYPMLDVIDEDDDIYVVVADFQERLSGLKFSVQGCKRPPVEPRVYGELTIAGRATGSSAIPATSPMRFVARAVGKCAATETDIQVLFERNGTQRLRTIPVNALYRFSIGIAAAYDTTEERAYSLRTLPGEGVPRIAQVDEPLGLTSLIHISFYPSPRDFRKTNPLLGQRIQFFVGLDPRKLDEHLVVGAGYELAMGLNVLLGWRALTRQSVLAEGSGVAPGSLFDGSMGDLPTRKRWETGGVFFGVGLNSSLLARLR
jgi:hypothetical protein